MFSLFVQRAIWQSDQKRVCFFPLGEGGGGLDRMRAIAEASRIHCDSSNLLGDRAVFSFGRSGVVACVVLCFSPHRVATSRSYACTSASQFWQEIYAESRTFLTCRGRYCICRQRGPLQLLVLQSVLLLAMHKSLVSPGVGSSLTFSPESRASGYEE